MRLRLPSFLNFLRPRLRPNFAVDEPFRLSGHVRVETWQNGVLIDVPYDGKNFILDVGLSAARDVLIGTNGAGFAGSIFRMALGDGGTPAGQLFTPKLPDATWPARTGLFHEVLRQDIASFSKPTFNSMRFVGSFNSTGISTTSYSLAEHVINECALIIGDGVLVVGGDKKQVNKTPPDVIDADEVAFSMRCFKSTPFDPAENVTITVTWTVSNTK